jgi:hypothetical protein
VGRTGSINCPNDCGCNNNDICQAVRGETNANDRARCFNRGAYILPTIDCAGQQPRRVTVPDVRQRTRQRARGTRDPRQARASGHRKPEELAGRKVVISLPRKIREDPRRQSVAGHERRRDRHDRRVTRSEL